MDQCLSVKCRGECFMRKRNQRKNIIFIGTKFYGLVLEFFFEELIRKVTFVKQKNNL
jgi:hypothetical protein